MLTLEFFNIIDSTSFTDVRERIIYIYNMTMEYKKRVLIVEDDKLLALVEERLIQKLGYEVVGTAESGEDALRLVKEYEPDIILMDISLKGDLDGIDTVEKIRLSYNTPVIFLSGNSDKYNYERAKKTEFIDYLVKPVTADDLIGPLKKSVEVLNAYESENSVSRAS